MDLPEPKSFIVGPQFIIPTGDGTPIPQLIKILRRYYGGGVKCDDRILQHITSEKGPTRFFRCTRERPRTMPTPRTYQQFLEDTRHNDLTYELGLRWFLTCPNHHLLNEGLGQRLIILPSKPLIINEKPQLVLISALGEGPWISLQSFVPETQIRDDADFITATELVVD